MEITDKIRIYNEDCLDAIKKMPDKAYDLAIVDPPYGIKIQQSGGTPSHLGFKNYAKKNWDNAIPSAEYFHHLNRVSVNQIIWGAIYFVEHLDKGTMGWVFWDKGQNLTMSDGELAFTSFNKALRRIIINRCEIKTDGAIHPTQKPVELLKTLIEIFTDEGDVVIDPCAGSGSTLIAAERLNRKGYGFEIKKEYISKAGFWVAKKRYAQWMILKNGIPVSFRKYFLII